MTPERSRTVVVRRRMRTLAGHVCGAARVLRIVAIVGWLDRLWLLLLFDDGSQAG